MCLKELIEAQKLDKFYRVIRLKVVKSKLLWLFMGAFLTPCGKDQNVFDYWQFHFDTGCILGI